MENEMKRINYMLGKINAETARKRRERSDWVMLCPSCHRKIEMGKEKLCLQ